ncbi:PASTA domain-containing protein [Pengzhenrongella sicca]|uniref:PASTA domain-containing protein n=1 Tax=Pengzhenrongella sicca TaxID=2819238 RepID=A0A8A4ZIX4_9MICO|nr:PASTA domain-containing protein [Pengzhenrongella sicca]QTE30929.1 PASTA domain-containing protein [Pengzhenrongella sicca]
MSHVLPNALNYAPAVTDPLRSNLILGAVGLLVLLGLLSVLAHRFIMQSKADAGAEAGMTRPVLAVLLVGTVLILAAASLSFKDTDTRNLLVGGVISLSSGVVAFYFASSSATEARRDLLTATGGGVSAPDVVGKTLQEAQVIISGSSVALKLPDPPPAAGATVKSQDPAAGTLVRQGSTLHLTF